MDADKIFWLAFRRALLALAAAIEVRYLKNQPALPEE
jgi:hypothetical protein